MKEGNQTRLLPIVTLSAGLLLSWTLWAVALRPYLPSLSANGESALGVAARLFFWGLPAGIYLRRYWGARWHEPLGLSFPLGSAQVIRTTLVTLLVAGFLLLGTAAQLGVSALRLIEQLISHAEARMTAPLFEELVFRGVVVAELLNWTHDTSRNRVELRLKFWGGQLFAAGVFLLVHWPWWLENDGFAMTLSRSLPVLTTGFILGFVFANTRSLWGCIFLHWLNNELSHLV